MLQGKKGPFPNNADGHWFSQSKRLLRALYRSALRAVTGKKQEGQTMSYADFMPLVCVVLGVLSH